MNQLTRRSVFSITQHALRASFSHVDRVLWDINVVPINRCNQACPHCNAVVLAQEKRDILTTELFDRIVEYFRPYKVPVCTISGGEPTLVPDMPDILRTARHFFPLKVMLITNLYGKWENIGTTIRSALETQTHIVCSFDGFGETADQLRGAPNVADRVTANLKILLSILHSISSRSSVELHTVLCDANISQVSRLLDFSAELGISHTFAPVNRQPQSTIPGPGPGLSPSQDLNAAVEKIRLAKNVKQLDTFIAGIPGYAAGTSHKHCPYKSRILGRYKVFIEPSGAISMCDRVPLGNIFSDSLESIFSRQKTMDFLDRVEACSGCWLGCFVEPSLATKPRGALDALKYRFTF